LEVKAMGASTWLRAFVFAGLLCASRIWGADGAGLVLGVDPKPDAGPPPLETRRSLRLERAATAPRLDGKLDDACWTKAAVTGDLRVKVGGKFQRPFPKKTVLRAAFDERTLYLAFESFDPDVANLLAKYTARDDKYWLDDDVEVMIDANYDRQTFHQFLFNAAGGKGDYACRVDGARIRTDGGYNPEWQLATRTCEDRWVAELALPFRILGVDGVVPGARWGFNFCRIENPGGILGNWTRAANHRVPELFGDLVFGRAPYALGEADLGAQAQGTNLLRATVANNTDGARPLAVALTVAVGDAPLARASCSRIIPAGGSETLFLAYELPLDATPAALSLEMLDPQWRRVIARRSYVVTPPPLLAARMDSVEYFESDKVARCHVDIHVGDVTAATGKLVVSLMRGRQVLSEDEVAPIPAGANALRVDIASLREGAYELALTVAGAGGRALASQRMTFAKTKSLMDF